MSWSCLDTDNDHRAEIPIEEGPGGLQFASYPNQLQFSTTSAPQQTDGGLSFEEQISLLGSGNSFQLESVTTDVQRGLEELLEQHNYSSHTQDTNNNNISDGTSVINGSNQSSYSAGNETNACGSDGVCRPQEAFENASVMTGGISYTILLSGDAFSPPGCDFAAVGSPLTTGRSIGISTEMSTVMTGEMSNLMPTGMHIGMHNGTPTANSIVMSSGLFSAVGTEDFSKVGSVSEDGFPVIPLFVETTASNSLAHDGRGQASSAVSQKQAISATHRQHRTHNSLSESSIDDSMICSSSAFPDIGSFDLSYSDAMSPTGTSLPDLEGLGQLQLSKEGSEERSSSDTGDDSDEPPFDCTSTTGKGKPGNGISTSERGDDAKQSSSSETSTFITKLTSKKKKVPTATLR